MECIVDIQLKYDIRGKSFQPYVMFCPINAYVFQLIIYHLHSGYMVNTWSIVECVKI